MNDFAQLIQQLRKIKNVEIAENVILAPYTSYRIGGTTALWIAPKTEEAVGIVLKTIPQQIINVFILGNGSNVLISNHGWRGITIYIGENLIGYKFQDTTVTVRAGESLNNLVNESVNNGLGGMELLAGIPGTVGGALRMNAGAFGQEIEATVINVYGFTRQGIPIQLSREEIDFAYRKAPQLQNMVITSAKFQFKQDDIKILHQRMEDVLKIRKQKQPLEYPSCGSVFKRPPGYFAAALIEEAGLKGLRYGDAQISEKHAGFIINRGQAKAEDVLALIRTIKKTVFERFGVILELEVKLIGWKDGEIK